MGKNPLGNFSGGGFDGGDFNGSGRNNDRQGGINHKNRFYDNLKSTALFTCLTAGSVYLENNFTEESLLHALGFISKTPTGLLTVWYFLLSMDSLAKYTKEK